jgi:hypothetical protein
MVTLEEAVAKYKLARDQLTLATAQATIPELRNRFPECQAALDAAVRDVALASAREAWNCNCDSAFAELNAEIDRLFGDK